MGCTAALITLTDWHQPPACRPLPEQNRSRYSSVEKHSYLTAHPLELPSALHHGVWVRLKRMSRGRLENVVEAYASKRL